MSLQEQHLPDRIITVSGDAIPIIKEAITPRLIDVILSHENAAPSRLIELIEAKMDELFGGGWSVAVYCGNSEFSDHFARVIGTRIIIEKEHLKVAVAKELSMIGSLMFGAINATIISRQRIESDEMFALECVNEIVPSRDGAIGAVREIAQKMYNRTHKKWIICFSCAGCTFMVGPHECRIFYIFTLLFDVKFAQIS